MDDQTTNQDNQSQAEKDTENPQWQYQSGQLSQNGTISQQAPTGQTDTPKKADQPLAVHWDASEFIAHNKSAVWYVCLILVIALLAVGIYFLTKDIFSVIIIAVIGVILGFFGAMKPRTLSYEVGPDGVKVGNKAFPFEDFRSFSVMKENSTPSVQLLPQKRFMVPIVMYFSSNETDQIVKTLGDYLPLENRKPDMVDKITSRLHL